MGVRSSSAFNAIKHVSMDKTSCEYPGNQYNFPSFALYCCSNCGNFLQFVIDKSFYSVLFCSVHTCAWNRSDAIRSHDLTTEKHKKMDGRLDGWSGTSEFISEKLQNKLIIQSDFSYQLLETVAVDGGQIECLASLCLSSCFFLSSSACFFL